MVATLEFFATNLVARWLVLTVSILVSVGMVSAAEGGLLKNDFRVPLFLMLGAVIYGAAVFSNFGKSEGSTWLILPAALAVVWNALNTLATLVVPFLTGASSVRSISGETLFLFVLFVFLALATAVVGGLLSHRLDGG